MATATAIAPTTTTAAPVPSIPFAPAGLLPWQERAIIHSGELATAKGLRLIVRGRVGAAGLHTFIVSSASRPDGAHVVWIERGRIHCDCEARTSGHSFTCSHAQFVRSLIVAELADARSLPDAARLHAAPKVEPVPTPEPEPPTPPAPTRRARRPRKSAAADQEQDQAPATTPEESSAPADGPAAGDGHDHDRQPCPNCGALTAADEISELGECLSCLQMRADFERAAAADARAIEEWAQAETERMAEELAQQLPCWCCGKPATAETNHGLYCDDCAKLPASEQRRRSRARLAAEKIAQTRARMEARAAETARAEATAIRHYTPQEQEVARRDNAREKARERRRTAKARGMDDARHSIYDRRDFSIWKSDQD